MIADLRHSVRVVMLAAVVVFSSAATLAQTAPPDEAQPNNKTWSEPDTTRIVKEVQFLMRCTSPYATAR